MQSPKIERAVMGRKAKERMAMRAEVASEVASILAAYPRYELHLVYEHRIRDMSVGGGYSDDMTIPLSEIRQGEALNTDVIGCGPVTAVEVSEERLVLNWEGVDYEVNPGIPVKTETYSVSNPYLSYEGVFLRFEYNYVSAESILSDTFDEIAKYHGSMERSEYPATTRKQILVLSLLQELCKRDSKWYIPLAVLSAADNWANIGLARPYIFRNLLFEGIRRGALSPENGFAWSWIKIAAQNDPVEFMDNKGLYLDLFAPAAEAGNEVARMIVETLSGDSNEL